MSDEFSEQLEKLDGINQLFIGYVALLESEGKDQDVHAMNMLLNCYSDLKKNLTKICDHYVQQNNKALELYVAQSRQNS